MAELVNKTDIDIDSDDEENKVTKGISKTIINII